MHTLFADYHTHTIYSHGKGTIMDNVTVALKKGLKEIAITDHGIGHVTYGVKVSNISRMREEIDKINASHPDIKVLLGMECNIISTRGDIDMTDEIRKQLDILLVGYHMMARPKGVGDAFGIYGRNYMARLWDKNTQHSFYRRVVENNTEIMVKAITKNKIDFITHPGARIPLDTEEVAKAAALAGTALEINAQSNVMNVDEIKRAAAQGVRFVINSDAHRPEDVGSYGNGLKLAEEAGLDADRIINAIRR